MNTGFIWGIRSRNGKESDNNLNTVNALRSRKTKGFTLVELIVVLVIIAILAAIAVPTMIAFIDRAREKKIQANAEAALTATQTKLNDLYSDAANSFTPEARNDARVLAGLKDVESEFIVWTKKSLIDGNTVAKPSNLGAYMIDSALYIENGSYYFYDGSDWTKSDSDPRDTVEGSSIIHVWPYERDTAYKGPKEYDPDKPDDEQEESDIKIVTLILPDDTLDHIYYSRVGRVENSGINSVDIIFWKEDDGIHSYWDTSKNPEEFKIDDYYTYFIHKDGGCYLYAWEDTERIGAQLFPGKDNVSAITKITDGRTVGTTGIEKYIFEDSSNKLKSSFTFKAVTEIRISAVLSVKISKPAFRGMLNAPVTAMEKVPYGSDGYESESVLRNEHPNAVRIDDKEIWDGYVYAWIDGGTLYWWTNADTVYMPEDCSGFFQGNTNLKYFNFSGFDMSLVTTAKNMFADATELKEVCLSNSFNATSLTNVSGMFKNTPALETLDEENNLKTGALSDVTSMFAGCGLSEIDLSASMNTSAITSIASMFDGCNAENIDLSNIDLNNTTDLTNTFANSSRLKTVVFTSAGTSVAPTTLKNTFSGCVSMTDLNLSSFNTSGLKSLEGTFSGCTALKNLNVSWNDVMSIETMHSAFEGLTSLETLDLGDHWNLKNCEDMSSAFKNCSKLENVDFTKFQTSYKLTNISYMFEGCESLTILNLAKINTSRVTDMYSVFKNCKKLENLNVTSFETTRVRHMDEMFAGTESLQELDLSTFNTDRTVSLENMFKYDLDGNGNAKTKLETVYASPKFVLPAVCQESTVFVNAVDLEGGRGTAYENVKTQTQDEKVGKYAHIDGWDGKAGYFTERAKKTYVNKAELKKFFGGAYGNARDIVKVAGNLTLDEVKAKSGSHSIKDVAKDKSENGGTETPLNVYAWMEGDVVKWWTDADMVCMYDTYFQFLNGNTTVEHFDFTGFDVTKVTSTKEMFLNNTNLKSVTLGNMFYSDSNINVVGMFQGCTTLGQGNNGVAFTDPANFCVGYKSNLTSLERMFKDCTSLTKVEFGDNFNTSNITTALSTFEGCSRLAEVNLTLDHATALTKTFKGCIGLSQIELEGWGKDGNGINNTEEMFKDCSLLTSVTLQDFKFNNGTKDVNAPGMFTGCGSSDSITNLKVSMTDCTFSRASNVSSMLSTAGNEDKPVIVDISKTADETKYEFATLDGLFYRPSGNKVYAKTIKMHGWVNDSVTSMANSFRNCTSLETIDFGTDADFSGVTNISYAFNGDTSLTMDTLASIGGLGLTKVTNVTGILGGCTQIENLTINGWGTEGNGISDASYMFSGCVNLADVKLNGFKFNNGTNDVAATSMFANCGTSDSVSNLKISMTDCKFTKASSVSSMLSSAGSATKPTIVDISKNTDETKYEFSSLDGLFYRNSGNKVYAQTIKMHGWVNSEVTSMANSFRNCTSLETIDFGTDADFSGVTNISYAFNGDTSLTQDTLASIGGLGLTKVTNVSGILGGCTQIENMTINGWGTEGNGISDVSSMFNGCSRLKEITMNDCKFVASLSNTTDMFKNTTADFMTMNLTECKFGNVDTLKNLVARAGTITTLDVSKCKDQFENLSELFSGRNKLENIDMSDWDTSKLLTMYRAFYGCTSLTSIDFTGWNDTGKLNSLNQTFYNDKNLDSATLEAIQALDLPMMDNLNSTFYGCSQIEEFSVSGWGKEGNGIVNLSSTFSQCTGLKSVTMEGCKISASLPDPKDLFANCNQLETLNMPSCDFSGKTANVRNIILKSDKIKYLDLSNREDIVDAMKQVFYQRNSLVKIDISNWKTSTVTDFTQTFNDCGNLETVVLDGLDTSSAMTMEGMFGHGTNASYSNRVMTELDISMFKTDNLVNIRDMFSRNYVLTKIIVDPTQWDGYNTGAVLTTYGRENTFKYCDALVGAGRGNTQAYINASHAKVGTDGYFTAK